MSFPFASPSEKKPPAQPEPPPPPPPPNFGSPFQQPVSQQQFGLPSPQPHAFGYPQAQAVPQPQQYPAFGSPQHPLLVLPPTPPQHASHPFPCIGTAPTIPPLTRKKNASGNGVVVDGKLAYLFKSIGGTVVVTNTIEGMDHIAKHDCVRRISLFIQENPITQLAFDQIVQEALRLGTTRPTNFKWMPKYFQVSIKRLRGAEEYENRVKAHLQVMVKGICNKEQDVIQNYNAFQMAHAERGKELEQKQTEARSVPLSQALRGLAEQHANSHELSLAREETNQKDKDLQIEQAKLELAKVNLEAEKVNLEVEREKTRAAEKQAQAERESKMLNHILASKTKRRNSSDNNSSEDEDRDNNCRKKSAKKRRRVKARVPNASTGSIPPGTGGGAGTGSALGAPVAPTSGGNNAMVGSSAMQPTASAVPAVDPLAEYDSDL